MEQKHLYDTRGTDIQWMKKLLFAGIFIQENKLHAIYDRYNEMTCKQWLLMVVSSAFDTPPDLSALAEAMGCSRQNVKKLAIHLEREGYIVLEKSNTDARALCVRKTPKGIQFLKENAELGNKVHDAIFQEFTEEEIAKYYQLSIKMMHGLEHLEEYFMEKQEKINP